MTRKHLFFYAPEGVCRHGDASAVRQSGRESCPGDPVGLWKSDEEIIDEVDVFARHFFPWLKKHSNRAEKNRFG